MSHEDMTTLDYWLKQEVIKWAYLNVYKRGIPDDEPFVAVVEVDGKKTLIWDGKDE